MWGGSSLWSHLSLTAPLSGGLVFSFNVERKPVGWQKRESSLHFLFPSPSSFKPGQSSRPCPPCPKTGPALGPLRFLLTFYQQLSGPLIWHFIKCHPIYYFEALALLIQLACVLLEGSNCLPVFCSVAVAEASPEQALFKRHILFMQRVG